MKRNSNLLFVVGYVARCALYVVRWRSVHMFEGGESHFGEFHGPPSSSRRRERERELSYPSVRSQLVATSKLNMTRDL